MRKRETRCTVQEHPRGNTKQATVCAHVFSCGDTAQATANTYMHLSGKPRRGLCMQMA